MKKSLLLALALLLLLPACTKTDSADWLPEGLSDASICEATFEVTDGKVTNAALIVQKEADFTKITYANGKTKTDAASSEKSSVLPASALPVLLDAVDGWLQDHDTAEHAASYRPAFIAPQYGFDYFKE